jgi:hypothetical protein
MDADVREGMLQAVGTAGPILTGILLGLLLFFVGCFP